MTASADHSVDLRWFRKRLTVIPFQFSSAGRVSRAFLGPEKLKGFSLRGPAHDFSAPAPFPSPLESSLCGARAAISLSRPRFPAFSYFRHEKARSVLLICVPLPARFRQWLGKPTGSPVSTAWVLPAGGTKLVGCGRGVGREEEAYSPPGRSSLPAKSHPTFLLLIRAKKVPPGPLAKPSKID